MEWNWRHYGIGDIMKNQRRSYSRNDGTRMLSAQIPVDVNKPVTTKSLLTINWLFICSLLFAVILNGAAVAANSDQAEFPGRATYPEVKTIALEALFKNLDNVVVVDVRSAFEFNTLHINNATQISISSDDYIDNIYKLRSSTDKDSVLYCNGKTCMKSYKAAVKCAKASIKGTLAYDAGIMDWAKTYPKHTTLLDKILNDSKLLISKENFKKHLLDPDTFADKVADGKAIVLDVRDRFQRDGLSLFPGRERRAYLDQTKKLDPYIKRAKQQGRALMVYDAAGKQVRWLQYYLEYKRVPTYFFMEGGARAFFGEMTDSFFKPQSK